MRLNSSNMSLVYLSPHTDSGQSVVSSSITVSPLQATVMLLPPTPRLIVQILVVSSGSSGSSLTSQLKRLNVRNYIVFTNLSRFIAFWLHAELIMDFMDKTINHFIEQCSMWFNRRGRCFNFYYTSVSETTESFPLEKIVDYICLTNHFNKLWLAKISTILSLLKTSSTEESKKPFVLISSWISPNAFRRRHLVSDGCTSGLNCVVPDQQIFERNGEKKLALVSTIIMGTVICENFTKLLNQFSVTCTKLLVGMIPKTVPRSAEKG